MDARQDSGDEDLRGRVLLALVPALVHRLNNRLTFARGVSEIELRGTSRAQALQGLDQLGLALTQLALFARAPVGRERGLSSVELLQTIEVLFRPVAETLKVRLGLSADGAAVFRVDDRFPGRFLALCHELLPRAESRPEAGMSVRLRARAGRLAFLVAATGTARLGPATESLRHVLAAHGEALRVRVGSSGSALRFGLPAEVSVPRKDPCGIGRRVWYLRSAGPEAEVVVLVLGEQGFRVHLDEQRPPAETIDLILVDEARAAADPDLIPGLRRRFPAARLERLLPRSSSTALLDLLRG